ncbi:hypothetical protein ADL12_18130 [Streptomyces regalis]|uniref:Uncharacterized protein n=1 Tax=Streptomyces regalis TaxID=68262 RepID=A0A0X3UY26_9ACTN|nr:hypothetical protein ADL12_18130 [Streptomyces regalis]
MLFRLSLGVQRCDLVGVLQFDLSEVPAFLEDSSPLSLQVQFVSAAYLHEGQAFVVCLVEPLRDRWRLYALTPAAGWGWC